MALFTKKHQHFTGLLKTFTPLGEDASTVEEERIGIQTTVDQELRWITPHLAPVADASLRLARANAVAVADIILDDGTVLASNVRHLSPGIGEVRGVAPSDRPRRADPRPGHGLRPGPRRRCRYLPRPSD